MVERKKLYIQAFETQGKHTYTWNYMQARTAKIERKNGFYRGNAKNFMKSAKFEDIFNNKHIFLYTSLERSEKMTLGSIKARGIPILCRKL